MDHKYVEDLHRKFQASADARSLFEKIAEAPAEMREDVLRDVNRLIGAVGFSYALLALYRQQVNQGFVLSDPLKPEGKERKTFTDPHTGMTLRIEWNPDRELRKEHQTLRERGIIAKDIKETDLIHKNKMGKACYLCKANIDVQNPREILLKTDLASNRYYTGANFAYITNNHFTIMSAEHRPQRYRKSILKVSNDFIDKTDGIFRVMFNGLAGASIEEHEHLQATTEKIPIEDIKIGNQDVIYKFDDLSVSHPKYYIPVWVVEGTNKAKAEDAADKIIRKWHRLDQHHHTENIIASRIGDQYRTFILLRDKRKLAGTGKRGAMAAFEAGGNIVLSYEPKVNDRREINEKQTFDQASLETIKILLKEISPEDQTYSPLARATTLTEFGS